jgi:hypothetical protein
MPLVQPKVAAFGLVRGVIAHGESWDLLLARLHLELAEILEPTKRRQWRFGKQDASPCPPSPPRPPRD